MNKYKVEFTRTETFCVDVLAKDEAEAKIKGGLTFDEVLLGGVEHYNETGSPCLELTTVYDVTNTDDPFNP